MSGDGGDGGGGWIGSFFFNGGGVERYFDFVEGVVYRYWVSGFGVMGGVLYGIG